MPVVWSVMFTKNCWFAKFAIVTFNATLAVVAFVFRVVVRLPVTVFVVLVVVVAVAEAVVVVVIVAAVTIPLPSIVKVIGLAMFSRF